MIATRPSARQRKSLEASLPKAVPAWLFHWLVRLSRPKDEEEVSGGSSLHTSREMTKKTNLMTEVTEKGPGCLSSKLKKDEDHERRTTDRGKTETPSLPSGYSIVDSQEALRGVSSRPRFRKNSAEDSLSSRAPGFFSRSKEAGRVRAPSRLSSAREKRRRRRGFRDRCQMAGKASLTSSM